MRLSKYVLIACFVIATLIQSSGYCELNVDWKNLHGRRLSSVAWSPDGTHVAFVATPTNPDHELDNSPKRAEIWLLPIEKKHPIKATRIARVKRELEGIPTSLFWLSNQDLAWSNAAATGFYSTQGFRWYSLSLKDFRLSPLTECSFDLRQSRSMDTYAPDDVYYDQKQHNIMFSGHVYGGERGKASHNLILLYDLRSRSLDVIPLQNDMDETVTMCGSASYDKPSFFIAAAKKTATSSEVILWHSTEWSLKPHCIITRSDASILFPRLSPDLKRIAWLETATLFTCDIKTGSRRSIMSIPENWDVEDPALGCPYSWSPKGDEIACIDGPKLRFIQISADTR